MLKSLIFFVCVFGLVIAHAQEKSVVLSSEDLLVHSDGSVLVDEKKWVLVKKDDTTSLYQRVRNDDGQVKRDRVELKRISGKKQRNLSSVVGVFGITGTSEKEAVWLENAEAVHFKDGVREFGTFCNLSQGCLSVNKQICDRYIQLLGVATGHDVISQEWACEKLKTAKGDLGSAVAEFTFASKTEANIKRVSGLEKVRDLTQSIFGDGGDPSLYNQVISGLCWRHYWQFEPKPANASRENAAQPKKTR